MSFSYCLGNQLAWHSHFFLLFFYCNQWYGKGRMLCDETEFDILWWSTWRAMELRLFIVHTSDVWEVCIKEIKHRFGVKSGRLVVDHSYHWLGFGLVPIWGGFQTIKVLVFNLERKSGFHCVLVCVLHSNLTLVKHVAQNTNEHYVRDNGIR